MLELKLQYFDHLMQRADSLEKTLMLVKVKGRKKRGAWGAAVHGVTKTETQLNDWTKQSWELNEATLAPTLCFFNPNLFDFCIPT